MRPSHTLHFSKWLLVNVPQSRASIAIMTVLSQLLHCKAVDPEKDAMAINIMIKFISLALRPQSMLMNLILHTQVHLHYQ